MPKTSQKTGEADFKAGVFQEYFGTKKFTYRQEIDRIDFIITDNIDSHLIWAETKKNTADIVEMFVQLILTIGKARTFDKYNPPPFLCVFDYHKIAFLQYNAVQDIFYQNDFNWNITPSNHKTKEFKQIKNIVENTVNDKNLIFSFVKDKTVLKEFIKNNFVSKLDLYPDLFARLQIDKNNFVPTYNRWVEMVKPSIAIDWDIAKKKGIIDADFYLADLLSEDNVTLKDKLFVLLKKTNYELDRQIDEMGLFTSKSVSFKDNGKSHRHFWELYIRPPKKEYWDYIVDRRDLLVPQDIRERKGSFFTPQIWVQKSQEYLTKVFDDNWQDEYFVWDCAAGTGNLLVGLTNKYNIWASTLDRQDVDVMKDRIKNGANLLESHVFQFDFLNDSFNKLPEGLRKIINDPKKRKKLIVYINPPYAEATNKKSKGINRKDGVAKDKSCSLIKEALGAASNELYAHFIARIYKDIHGCCLAMFSKLKFVNSQNFKLFRSWFLAHYKNGFVVHANTFDNVKGNFPIAFSIWQLGDALFPKYMDFDVINGNRRKKRVWSSNGHSINQWIKEYNYSKKEEKCIGILNYIGNDFQQNERVWVSIKPSTSHILTLQLTKQTIIPASIYFAVRLCIVPTWLEDRDQFLYPSNDNYKKDKVFQSNCLVFMLFHGQNRISFRDGTNHWIPFTAEEVNAKDNFKSDFMNDFIKSNNRKLSKEAKTTFKAGRELWKYYHFKIAGHRNAPLNASLYDIREFFQGRTENGNMKTKSVDETYNALIKDLRQKMSVLAEEIKPKVYEYGFLVE